MKKIVKFVAAAVFAVSLAGVVSAQYYADPGYGYGYPAQTYPAGQAVVAPTPIYAHQGGYYSQPTTGDCQGGMCGVSYGGCGDCAPCGTGCAPLRTMLYNIWNGQNHWPGPGCSECVVDEMRKSWVSCPQCNVYGENLNAGPNSLGTGYRSCILLRHANPQPGPMQMVTSGIQTQQVMPGQQPVYHAAQPMMTPAYPAPQKPGCSSCGGGVTVTMNAPAQPATYAPAPVTYAPQVQPVSYQIQQQMPAQPGMFQQPVIIQQPQQPAALPNGASRRVNRHTSYYPPAVGGEGMDEAVQPTAGQAQQAVFAVNQPAKVPAYIRAQQNAKAQLGQPTFQTTARENTAEAAPVQQFQAFQSVPAQNGWVAVSQYGQNAQIQSAPVPLQPISQPVMMPQVQQIPQAPQIMQVSQAVQPQYIKIVPAAASQSVLAQPPMSSNEIPATQIIMPENGMGMPAAEMSEMPYEMPRQVECGVPCDEFRAPCLLPGVVRALGCIFSRKPACNNVIPMGNAQLHTMPSYARTVSGASEMQTLYTPATCNRGLFRSMADGSPFNGFFAMRSCCGCGGGCGGGCASGCGGGCGGMCGQHGAMEPDLDHDADLRQMGLDTLASNRPVAGGVSATSPYGRSPSDSSSRFASRAAGRTDTLLTLSTQRLRLDDGTEVVLEHDQTRAQRLAEQQNTAVPAIQQVSHQQGEWMPEALPEPEPAMTPAAPVESEYPIIAAEQPQLHLAPGEVLISEQDFLIQPPENSPQFKPAPLPPTTPPAKTNVTAVSYEEEIHVSRKPVLKSLGENVGNPKSVRMLKPATPMER